MAITVRAMTREDRDTWARLRTELWPEDTAAQHLDEVCEILRTADAWGFLAETRGGAPVGFAELSIRNYANGCTERPVAFLEGIWTDPAHRRTGIGRSLLEHVERFLIARGFREICSDALAENAGSRSAHRGWGFAETETVVCFRKPLHDGRRR